MILCDFMWILILLKFDFFKIRNFECVIHVGRVIWTWSCIRCSFMFMHDCLIVKFSMFRVQEIRFLLGQGMFGTFRINLINSGFGFNFIKINLLILIKLKSRGCCVACCLLLRASVLPEYRALGARVSVLSLSGHRVPGPRTQPLDAALSEHWVLKHRVPWSDSVP